MDGSTENNPTLITHPNVQGVSQVRVGKMMAPIGHNRRALRDINRNIIGVHPHPSLTINKTAPFEKDARSDRLPPNPGQRPITRKFAAEMAKTQCSVIEDTPVPMFVQHTEAMLKEIDRMDEEVEMEDIDEEILDIDSCDKSNPLAVTEYIDDIYAYYKKVETSSCVPPNYMDKQLDVNARMRAILIDWLIEVHYKFELMEETLYLTVNLIDRFLSLHPVVRKKLQLVGVTAMLLACKYEEVSVPVVEDLVLISDKAYSRQEVLQMERLMINTLKFNLSVPTPYVFMRRFLKAAEADKKLELLSFFLIELCLVEYEMLRFPPSLLAAAAVYTAQCTLSCTEHWTKTSEWHTGYSQDHLLECSRLMVDFHQKAGTGRLTGVHRKYSTSKFGYAARCKPALFLIESMGFSGWTSIN